MKSKKQNPNGLHKRYIITKSDGTPVRHDDYFVLSLNSSDEPHRLACRRAVNEYSKAIAPYMPKLAKDIKEQWPNEPKSLSLAKLDGSFYGKSALASRADKGGATT